MTPERRAFLVDIVARSAAEHGRVWTGPAGEALLQSADAIRELAGALAESDATIAAERGDPSGALPGWEWTAQSWRSGDQIVIRVAFGAWDVLVRLPGAPVEILRVTTAREGMRLANERVDAARAVAT